MNSNESAAETRISRWRWWIHLTLIGGYIVPGILLPFIQFTSGELLWTTRGLLIVCTTEIPSFTADHPWNESSMFRQCDMIALIFS
ncbi:MAG: hypothetical protein ABR514_03955 [Chthoniobacterales bacterium]